jgi:type II secretory pathway pseudopilin PulG
VSAVHRQHQSGFTYIGLLIAVAVMGLMLTMVARVWATTEERERETQLLWVGHAYRTAIASYFAAGHHFPATLQELLQDDRTPVPRHHLRRLYPDPMTGKPDWSLVLTADGQGIMGVASGAKSAPIKRKGFELFDQAFTDADCVCLWQFIYYPNRFSRGAVGQTIGGNGALTPGNTQGQQLKAPDTFRPGTINSLPPSTFGPDAAASPAPVLPAGSN